MRNELRAPKKKVLREFLRSLREEQDLSQCELARRLGKDQTFVSKYETGERRLDVLEIMDLCDALGITFLRFCRRLEKLLREKSATHTSHNHK